MCYPESRLEDRMIDNSVDPDKQPKIKPGRYPKAAKSLAAPYLATLEKLRNRQPASSSDLLSRVRAMLSASPGIIQTAYNAGATGLVASHTHYFDGFALLMLLPHGTAIGYAPDGPRGFHFKHSGPAGERPITDQIVSAERIARRVLGETGSIAVASNIPYRCEDAFWSSFVVALLRISHAAQQEVSGPTKRSNEAVERARTAASLISKEIGRPYSSAYTIASQVADRHEFVLVDVRLGEYLTLAHPSPEDLVIALVDVQDNPEFDSDKLAAKMRLVDKAVATLQKKGLTYVETLRDLDHADLVRALNMLPKSQQPVIRHLVSENRRVAKVVAAIRKEDWQFLGALLLMSHASLQRDWAASCTGADTVVSEVERMATQGLHGACMTGSGGCVIVVGHPFAVPTALESILAHIETTFGYAASSWLL